MNFKRVIAFLLVILGVILMIISGMYIWDEAKTNLVSPLAKTQIEKRVYPLIAYSFPTLRHQPAHPSQIVIERLLQQEDSFRAYQFSFITEGKRMTGQLNVPQEATPAAGFPVIVMLRGFVDPQIYTTGVGTRNAAAALAQNGFVTIAPDFLGYGESDNEDIDVMAARLVKPKQVVDLLSSLSTLTVVNDNQIGMWGHSNGGQIALSVLEITGRPIPTSLWAPVSVSFPYSILFYTNEAEDQGKALRKVLATFETDYDVFDFSIDRYFDWIAAPILLHHGTADAAAPVSWSRELNAKLTDLDKEIEYYEYMGADHNLQPAWNEVVARDITFFELHLRN